MPRYHPLDGEDLKKIRLFLDHYNLGTSGDSYLHIVLDAEEALTRIRERLERR